MIKYSLIYFTLFLLSASVLCFEIVSTRITSVIFVNDYAFIILSLAILGLGSGGIYSYYRLKAVDHPSNRIYWLLLLWSASLCVFIVSVIALSITTPFLFFFLLFLPFFIAGLVYAQAYKIFSEQSFTLYACDLSGAALGSVGSLGLLTFLGGPNSIIFIAMVVCCGAVGLLRAQIKKIFLVCILFGLVLSMGLLLTNGKKSLWGEVPIGYFPEKDLYYVYSDPSIRFRMLENRWSIYGRSDLVQYSHQDMVRQLFIDGAAGTQLYRFNGNLEHTNSILQELLLQHTNSIPFLCLQDHEKRSMLIIGPGGGKEVLIGLLGGVKKITGVEVNSDFIELVKEYKDFDGGIYSRFPNVNILNEEGRHFVKQSKEMYDLIVMALPSTEQMQNIELFAMSENFLLTKEALRDYMNILTPEGRMIFTVHNRWELLRLLTTTASVMNDMGIRGNEAQNYIAVFDAEYTPTVVIKKNVFTKEETLRWKQTCDALPQKYPQVTYLPYGMKGSTQSAIYSFLTIACQSDESLQAYIARHPNDISPCKDDNPYFYKIHKGVPDEYLWLLSAILCFNVLVVWLPVRLLRKKKNQDNYYELLIPLIIFICIGIGFMVLEISLFQKFILYLGSPTVSLSILLSALLVGMGVGSIGGRCIIGDNLRVRLLAVSMFTIMYGIILFLSSPYILSKCLVYSTFVRSIISFILILPLGVSLGIPFPTCIQMLRQKKLERFIPWMYGVNGAMSVLGSVFAVILSMQFGFTPTFFIGLLFYATITIPLYFLSDKTFFSQDRVIRRSNGG
jgi:predicted membrane-bound spermidine synthase